MGLTIFLIVEFLATALWAADQIEMSTYVPATLNGDLDRLHAKRATVGSPYSLTGPNPSDSILADGTLLVSQMIGIGTFTTTPPQPMKLRIRGADDAITRVAITRGNNTGPPWNDTALFVGLGTEDPKQMLDIVEPDNDAFLWLRAGGDGVDNYCGIELFGGSAEAAPKWQIAHKLGGAGANNDFQINFRDAAGNWGPPELAITPAGNVGIGTTNPTGSITPGTRVLAIAQGTTSPEGGRDGQGLIFAAPNPDAPTVTELFVMDEIGNRTQISPHDARTGEWIFYSKNTRTGRVVRIRIEQMVQEFERLTGKEFIDEWTEDPQR